MFKEIIFTSSYSSQIGSFLALKESQNDRDMNNLKQNHILVVHINTKNDLKCKYSFYNKYSILLNKAGNKFFILKINNFLKRLFLYFAIYFLNVFFKNKVKVWEPRPEWINSLFITKFIKLPRILQNKKTNYYGDGFLCLSRSNPFWLNDKKFKAGYKINLLSKFYYHIDVEQFSFKEQYLNNHFEIKSSKIIRFLNEIIDFDDIKLNRKYISKYLKNKSSLVIFPLTTFTETRRATFNDEIRLYLDYFSKNINPSKNLVIIKSHPNSSFKKINSLYIGLKKLKYNVILPKQFEEILNLGIPLEIIPMELLCLKVHKLFNIAYQNITIPITSNVTLSTLKIFPKIKYIKPFGKLLISKYIKKEYINKRLKQENIISNKLKKLYV